MKRRPVKTVDEEKRTVNVINDLEDGHEAPFSSTFLEEKEKIQNIIRSQIGKLLTND